MKIEQGLAVVSGKGAVALYRRRILPEWLAGWAIDHCTGVIKGERRLVTISTDDLFNAFIAAGVYICGLTMIAAGAHFLPSSFVTGEPPTCTQAPYSQIVQSLERDSGSWTSGPYRDLSRGDLWIDDSGRILGEPRDTVPSGCRAIIGMEVEAIRHARAVQNVRESLGNSGASQ